MKNKLTPDEITRIINAAVAAASNGFGVTEADIRGKSRVEPICWARQTAHYLADTVIENQSEIARQMGAKACSVCYSIGEVSDRLAAHKYDRNWKTWHSASADEFAKSISTNK